MNPYHQIDKAIRHMRGEYHWHEIVVPIIAAGLIITGAFALHWGLGLVVLGVLVCRAIQ